MFTFSISFPAVESMAVDSGYDPSVSAQSAQSLDPRLLTLHSTQLGIREDMDGELIAFSVAVLTLVSSQVRIPTPAP